jgi:hypothetical protein
MFNAFKIKLFLGDEWIYVKISAPRTPPTDQIETRGEWWDWMTKYYLSGSFTVRENSVTKASDPGKFVLSTKYPDAFWAYSYSSQELNFISRGNWGGGGLGHGEKQLQFNPVLTLHGAKVTKQGVQPISDTGKATVKSGGYMPMLSHKGNVVNWEWRQVDWPAEQG